MIPEIPAMNAHEETALPQDTLESLVAAAREAAQNAHCPYSGYRVGAALLAADGRVFRGCNVENASYGLTLCAERNAITTAVAEGCRDFRALAIAGGTAESPAFPCGACRQVMAEFCGPDFPVVVAALEGGEPTILPLADLLPHSFNL